MKPISSALLGLMALAAVSPLPLPAEDASLPPLGQIDPQQSARLTLNVQNCLVDVIVNISDQATGKTVYRKYMEMVDRHSFSLKYWGKEGAYRLCIVPANVEHRSMFQREIVRDIELKKGKAQTVDADFEENRPADLAPLPSEEQIDQFCQGDTQALQDYLGAPNSVLLVYVYEVTLVPNEDERMNKLYGLVRTTKVMVLQSTDPDIKAGERLQWSHTVETGDAAGVELGRFEATPFEPSLMYITNPHKVEEGKLREDTGQRLYPMRERWVYHYLRASHGIHGHSGLKPCMPTPATPQ